MVERSLACRRSKTRQTPWRTTALLTLLLLAAVFKPADAIERLDAEETIADLLPPQLGGETEQDLNGRKWAVLPQFGYGPDTGVLAGVKFAHRDLFDTGTSIDLNGVYAIEGQQSLSFSIASPRLLDDHLILLLRANYYLDPQREFFGIGNDSVDGPVSTHEFQDLGATFSIGWRFLERLAVVVEAGVRQVDIRNGKPDSDIPPPNTTPKKFPDLPGVYGGQVNPIALSLVWNTRDDVMRPTQGWRLLLKAIHTDKAFLSDFEFSRFLFDAGYLYSFNEGKQVIGARFNGEWIDGPSGETPFWELSELGGSDTLRGFFPHRFLGRARALINLELRSRLVEFDFFKLWHVHIDGVIFGDTGRVFVDNSELRNEFHLNGEIFDRLVSDFQFSYGPGLRITLSDALVARIDAGFSKEETGQLFLSFGQTF
ncbi:MAG TPA: BamA/TamA family outer membrane protein [Candidatus Acidoferrales bacterium]|nr:BamA/TamA family outer membrane protein [Candidatus Acidoferrales bacterium]